MPDSNVVVNSVGDGSIHEVVLSRPATGNSLNPEVTQQLVAAIKSITEEARCVVLRSEGRVFCSGADLSFLESLLGVSADEIATSIYSNFQGLIRAIVECPIPVIARLQGGAAGAGCDLALACDFIVASETGWLEESWIKIGATSALAGGFHLAQSVGPHRALDLLISSRRLGASEALQCGLVYRVVAPDELDGAITELAALISEREPLAVRAMKHLVRGSQRAEFERALEDGRNLQAALLSRPEFELQVESLRNRLLKKPG
jgi:2-(1,2-epoxy-1,2-dihydrophenyl)acetyl-CoA isomerase